MDEDNHIYDYTNLDHPQAWHVVDAQNGIQKITIRDGNV